MTLISNGDGTATDTGTGTVVPLTTPLAQGVPADGYQAQSTPAPTQTDNTARLWGGLANSVITGGTMVATSAFGGASPLSAFPGVGSKPAAAPSAGFLGLSNTQLLVGGAALVLASDYLWGWLGIAKKIGLR